MSKNKKVPVKDLIMPYFIVEGERKKEKISSLPGIYRLSADVLLKDLEKAAGLGIKAVLLFGKSGYKDSLGSYAYKSGGAVQKAIRAVKKEFPRITVISDVCLCGSTDHGHCSLIKEIKKGKEIVFDRERTLKALSLTALSHALSGADYVAPSAMALGQVKAIRSALDRNGLKGTKILSYSAKFASGFYGPFRDALASSPKFSDRSSYQLDIADAKKALSRIGHDIKEGADIVMVKPALPYLDIIHAAKLKFKKPLAAYNVSGEYSMIKKYARDEEEEKRLVTEVLNSIKRAGADMIISYHAAQYAEWMKNGF